MKANSLIIEVKERQRGNEEKESQRKQNSNQSSSLPSSQPNQIILGNKKIYMLNGNSKRLVPNLSVQNKNDFHQFSRVWLKCIRMTAWLLIISIAFVVNSSALWVVESFYFFGFIACFVCVCVSECECLCAVDWAIDERLVMCKTKCKRREKKREELNKTPLMNLQSSNTCISNFGTFFTCERRDSHTTHFCCPHILWMECTFVTK